MAKKNSSKTATEKAIQSSEPRVMSYGDWKGINFVDSPLTWNPLETGRYDHNQSDLPKNYLMVQNNIVTTDTLSLETRHDSNVVFTAPSGVTLTGICTMFHQWLMVVGSSTVSNSTDTIEKIYIHDLTSNNTTSYTEIGLIYWSNNDNTGAGTTRRVNPVNWHITEIGCYQNNLIALATNQKTSPTDESYILQGGALASVFLGKLNYSRLANYGKGTITIQCDKFDTLNPDDYESNYLTSNPLIADPTSTKPVLTVTGMSYGSTSDEGTVNSDTGVVSNSHVVKIEVVFCYTSKFGSSIQSLVSDPLYVEFQPTLWSSARFVTIKVPVNNTAGLTGIDFYGRDTENTNYVFIGHIDTSSAEVQNGYYIYNWLGNMTDISQWTHSQLNIPTANDTQGPNARHFAVHDSKIYYWGDPIMPYRLYIGGSPGNEFSVARGLGGAWIDIEPNSGYDIMGTAKWKTVSGANIVTIMCGNSNTGKVKRFNLVETNITITNEISYKGYMYEEVSNVVGCNSRYGYGVFGDGLYSVSRYGLYLTTMAMEYNSQMKNQSVSETIKPIFSERLGNRIKDCRMVFIDDVIYIAMSAEGNDGEGVTNLDNVILCYDTINQAWYTFTHDETLNRHSQFESNTSNANSFYDTDQIHHIFNIDSDMAPEGLGVITDNYVTLYPTAGHIQSDSVPLFDIIIETGELMPKEPMQVLSYIQQVELRFDYFVSDPSNPPVVLIEGVDYYGRTFIIEKQLNIAGGRGHHGKTGEMRDYVEWIRIDRYVESWRMRIKGKARFRLSHWNVKWYQQSDNIGTQWGFDAYDYHQDAHNTSSTIHHYINDYNNLRRAVIS